MFALSSIVSKPCRARRILGFPAVAGVTHPNFSNPVTLRRRTGGEMIGGSQITPRLGTTRISKSGMPAADWNAVKRNFILQQGSKTLLQRSVRSSIRR
jgi:hypothetical protein